MFFLWVETLPDQKRQSLFPNSRVCACVWGGGIRMRERILDLFHSFIGMANKSIWNCKPNNVANFN